MPGLSRENTPPRFKSAMDTILPPTGGKYAVIASGFGPRNVVGGSKNHKAIDFGYPGPDPVGVYRVHSPITGTVISTTPRYNVITIRDSAGYLHEFLHNDRILVNVGSTVNPGTPIGLMGGKGPAGRLQYAVHVHYQLKDRNGTLLNPIEFWEGNKQLFVNLPRQENGLPVTDEPESDSITAYDLAASEVPYFNQTSEGSSPTISSYRPRMAAIAPKSGAIGALLPNRMPEKEPWPRSMLVNTAFINGPTDEIEYNSRLNPQLDPDSKEGAQLIGRLEGDIEIPRNPFWRR